jgi:hypothetical protein
VTRIGGNLVYFDSNMNIKWKSPLNTHHRILIDEDEDEILTLLNEEKPYKGETVRFDSVVALNFEGKVTKKFDFFNFRDELKGDRIWLIKTPPKGVKTNLEFSHANIIRKIPANQLAGSMVEFEQGNYIVNVTYQNVLLILDKNMNQLLRVLKYNQFKGMENLTGLVHDAQVLKNGKILLYINGDKQTGSSINLLDPLSMSSEVLISSKRKIYFYSKFNGSAQLLPENKLFFTSNGERGEVHLVNYKTLEKSNTVKSPKLKEITTAYLDNMDGFLRHNQGL